MRHLLFALIAASVVASACERESVVGPSPDGHAGAPTSGSAPPSLTLAEVTAGTTATSNNYVGQSVIIPGRGAFNRIRFNWFHRGTDPIAFGTLYVLDREFLGTPGDLSASTPGFVARSGAVGEGQYIFHPGVVLKAGQQYWFYTDARGDFMFSFSDNTYAGGDMYITGMPNLPFRKAAASGYPAPPPPGAYTDANFRLDAR
jgi:hypothetical protein